MATMLLHRIQVILKALFIQSRFALLTILLLPASFLYKILSPKESLWLVGENDGKCLYDNGYIFYKFCRNTYPRKSIYFIAIKDSISLDPFLQKDSNIIVYGSLKHIFFFLLSDTLIYSHAQSDVGYIQLIKVLKRNCTRVFLQHGIIAFKKIHTTYRKNHNEMDIFIVSSDFEKNIVLDNFNFNKNALQITGLARYDTLSKKAISLKKSILYMPTWREWALPKRNAAQYILAIKDLLQNKYLMSLIKKHGIQFNFFIHSNMRCYSDDFQAKEGINILNSQENNVHDLIKANDLLITDYSSVAWDFYYLGSPVLFYQFDQEEYLTRKGSYINFDNDLFGEVFKECNPLIAAIEKYITSNFAELPEYAEKRDLYFNFRDTHNCSRIFDTITSYNKTKHG